MSDYSSMATLQNNSQTAGFATAVQRARLVAAKLGGGKRSLEDGPEPIAKKVAPVEPAYQQQQQQPQHQVMSGPASSSISPMSGGPGVRPPPTPAPPAVPPNLMADQSINDYIRVPDKMVGLIIGRGGEQITRLQAESGCKIQMAPDSGGQPDRLCTLTGSREAIQRAKELVNQIVNHRGRENAPLQHQESQGGGVPMPPMIRGGGGGPTTDEIMLPGPKVGLIIGKNGKTIKQLQEQSGAKMIVIQDGPNTEYEKPLRISGDSAKVEHAKQLVFELLADKDMQNRYDDGFNSDQGNGLATNSTEVLVPKMAVGVVIGRGGDMIKKIQADTGARVQFHQERDEGPGDKRCYLQGKPHQVEQARQMIEDLISSVNRREQEVRSNRGRAGSGQRNGDRPPEFAQQWQETPEVRVTFTVSNVKCGLIIGRGGEVIKQINAQSGAHCELDRRAQGMDRNNRTFYIKGHPEAVDQCKRIILEKVGIPVNFIQDNGNGNNGNGGGNGGNGGGGGGGNGGNGGGGGGGSEYYGVGTPAAWGYNPHWHQPSAPQQQQQQVSINPTTGQPDYSQQWIDYYRSLGLMREAEAIEQQAKQSASAPMMPSEEESPTHGGPSTPVPAPSQSSGGVPTGPSSQPNQQPDYSAQWAEYYRNMGKIKEAEAIEAQIKLKQGQQMSEQQMQQPVSTPSPAPSSSSANANAMMAQYGAPQYNMYAAGVYPGYAAYQYAGGGVQSATTPDPNQQ